MLSNIIGNRIREYRRQKGMTQEQLAELLLTSHQVISKWENALATPDIQSLYIIAQIFNVSLDEVCGKQNDAEQIVKQAKENFPYKDICDFEILYNQWVSLYEWVCIYPTNENLLIYALRYLRKMHDCIRTEEQKKLVNSLIEPIAQRILDISHDDDNRSLANYNLAIYYDEQINVLYPSEENREIARLARKYAERVLYKDMHKTFYHLFGCESLLEQTKACEKTLVELMDAVAHAMGNLERLYEKLDRAEEKSRIRMLEMEFKQIIEEYQKI